MKNKDRIKALEILVDDLKTTVSQLQDDKDYLKDLLQRLTTRVSALEDPQPKIPSYNPKDIRRKIESPVVMVYGMPPTFEDKE